MTAQHFDVIIVGSGFGGSVSAYRLAEGGLRVCVLERGKAYPPGSFPRRPRDMAANVWDPSRGSHGMFNVWSFRDIEAVVSSGLGGGSLIYANVLLRKDPRWFRQRSPDGHGFEDWPVTRDDLEVHYDRVEQMLGAQPFPFDAPGYDIPKTRALQEAAGRLGHEWGLPNLAVTFANPGRPPVPGEQLPAGDYPNLHGRTRVTCRLCGECDIGCNDGSKNTLDHTYLSAAVAHGAEIRTRSEVRTVAARPGGGYEIGYVEHHPDNEGRRTATSRLATTTLTADRVVMAAGSLGSTYLLMRNRDHLPGLSAALGTRFCGNGDLLSFVRGAKQNRQPRWLDASRGPVITSYLRVPDQVDDGGEGDGFYIEDAGYPVAVDWLLEGTTLSSTARRLARFAGRRLWRQITNNPTSDVSAELGRLLGDAKLSAASLPLLGMGRDVPDGVMGLRGGFLEVDWSMKTSRDYFERVDETMAKIAETLEGSYRRNPLWRLNRVVTVHPLGGAPMGHDAIAGVVDPFGEAYGHPGLYVADGAVMPGPVGANPSLTIAAFADRMCDRILESPAPPPARVATTPVALTVGQTAAGVLDRRPAVAGLEFTEEMKGFVTLADVDFETGYEAGREADRGLMFRLTIDIDDVGRFVADPDNTAAATGWVNCAALGGRRLVERGVFNLFVDCDDGETTHMRYRLFFTDGSGRPLTLSGFKVLRDDPGFDLWRDTTTLFTRILEGHIDDGDDLDATVIASGILVIHVRDFLKQLTTFRSRGPDRGSEVAAFAAFGALFMGKLWDTYGGWR